LHFAKTENLKKMSNTRTVTGFYGMKGTNRSDVFVYDNLDGSHWYALEGSTNINCTYNDIEDGVNVETLNDFDTLGADNPVNSEEDLINEIEN
jgi:hypothetical protein